MYYANAIMIESDSIQPRPRAAGEAGGRGINSPSFDKSFLAGKGEWKRRLSFLLPELSAPLRSAGFWGLLKPLARCSVFRRERDLPDIFHPWKL